ncbi:MAG: hypothetical protein OHK0039_00660 [Bacteroidia bacterium]
MMRPHTQTGWLLVAGAFLLFVPYAVLAFTFDYPDILRQDSGTILTRFHEAGPSLIWTWWAFAMVGLPLLVACVQLGQQLETRLPFMRWATTLGVVGLVVQMTGLLRWVFVVPVLARSYATGDAATQAAARVGFELMHQLGGVLLGEHIGQLFTIAWTISLAYALGHLGLLPRWAVIWGYVAGGIYLLAQTELFATVMPGLPVVGVAGWLGSTLWLVWLLIVGVRYQGPTRV